MTVLSSDCLKNRDHELEAIRAELVEVRYRQMQQTTKNWWRVCIGFLAVPLIMAASWAWSAQNSEPTSPGIEKRLNVLENLIRKGSRNTTQVTAPLEVMSSDGKVILYVGSGKPPTGAVAIWAPPDKPGKVAIRSEKGHSLAELGVKEDGYGVVIAADEDGIPRAELNGAGRAIVFGEDKKQLAAMGAGEHLGEVLVVGRVAVINDDGVVRAALNNSGQAVVFDEDKNPVVKMEAIDENRGRVAVYGEVIAVDQKENKVAGIEVTSKGHGEVAVWSKESKKEGKKAGVKVASMEGRDDDSGAMIVMNSTGKAIAKLSADQDSNAGKLTVMNPEGKPVASMMGGQAGGGVVAVANPQSVPQAQLSVSDEGRGLVQVFKNTKPVAVLTEAVERPGGLLQIFNSNGPVANVTVGETGGGYFQLTNAAGLPTIEAGTLPNGKGTVRAGPGYRCATAGTPLFRGGGLPDCLVGSTGAK
ncbi:MAG: hypothetical protein KIS97_05030 [Nitrospira sp.]|nr:hypothetical protein [Nitrospira sp.]